jgi:Flp pilus assembly protein TadD
MAGACRLEAALKGFDSSSINLGSFTIGKDLALPKIVLKPSGGAGGTAGASGAKLEVTTKLGAKFYSLADGKGVVAAAQAASAASPKDPALLLKLAQAQVSVWEDKEAIDTLTRALALTPDSIEMLTERGHRYLPLRQFAQARDDLGRAVAKDAKNMAGFYHLGLANYFLGDFTAASEAFRHAVETAPNTDEVINSTNWLYAALRRAGRAEDAAKALEAVPPEMTNKEPHTRAYLNLVRFFQGRMKESDALPPEPPAGNTDTELELPFDTVAYGIGNWYVCNGSPTKAREYFQRVMKGRVWITWGFIGSEVELGRAPK